MPKTLATRIKLEGESELRAALKNLKSSYKELESGLKEITSGARDQANTMDTLRQKTEQLSSMVSKQEEVLSLLRQGLEKAQAAQKAYTEQVQEAKDALDALGERTEDNADAYDAQAQKLEQAQRKQQQAANTVNAYSTEVNLAKVKLNDLNYELEENRKYLEEAEQSTDGTAQSIDEFGKKVEDSGSSVDILSAALGNSGLTSALEKVKDAVVACAEASIEFESAITGVYKTVDGSDEQLAAISEGVKELALRIPATTTEIAGVAEAAGQLGIAADDILGFTEVMINLGEATNLSADEAATSLAKFANITGMSADNYERLGSVIVDLGNNMATTESDIVAMATNIASAGVQAGLTEDQIMGMAAALSSVGLEAQAGGTAISKLIINMLSAAESGGEAAEQFAEVCGMTAEEFSRAFGEDAAGTLSTFFQGLGSGSQSAIATLEEMGVTETRLRDTMLRLASSGDTFSSALKTANTAWEQNTALTVEANKRYGTTESKLQLLKNSFTALKTEIGDRLTPIVQTAADAGTGVLGVISQIITDCPLLVNILEGVVTAAGALALGIGGVNLVTKILIPLWQSLSATMTASQIGIVAVALGALVTVGTAVADAIRAANAEFEAATASARDAAESLDEITRSGQDSVEAVNATAEAAKKYIGQLEALEAKTSLTNEEQERYAQIVERLRALMPDLNIQISEQTGLIEGGAAALRSQAEAWRETAVAQALYSQRQELLSKQADVIIEKTKNEARLSELQAEQSSNLARARMLVMEYAMTEYGMGAEAAAEYAAALSDMEKGASYAIPPMVTLAGINEELTGDIATNNDEQRELNAEIEYGAEVVASYETELSTLDGVEQQLTGTNSALAASETEKTTAIQQSVETITAEMQTLIDEYNAAYESALQTADSVASAFENMSARSQASLEEMTQNVASQADYWDEYNATLAAALEKVDPEMVEFILSFANGSQESLGYLEAIANGSETEIKELCDNLARVQEGKKTFATEVAATSTEFDTRAAEIETRAQQMVDEVNSQTSEWTSAGQANVQGYIDGMNSKLAEVKATAAAIAQAGVTSAKQTTDQHSPSRVYRRLAELDFAGYIQGAEESEQDVRAAVRRTAEGAAEAAGAVRLASRQTGSGSSGLFSFGEERAGSSFGGQTQTAHITLVADGKTLGEVVTPYVSDSIQRRTVQLRRGNGG